MVYGGLKAGRWPSKLAPDEVHSAPKTKELLLFGFVFKRQHGQLVDKPPKWNLGGLATR